MTRMPADNPQPSRRAMQALIQGVTTFDLAFAAVCLGAALLVYLAGAPPEIALIVGLAPFIGRHLYLLYRLSSLIGRHHRFTPPFPRGSWGRVFQAIAHYQQAIRRRRRSVWVTTAIRSSWVGRAEGYRQMIPFLNLKAQHASIEPALLAAFKETLATTQFVLGSEVAAFEE